VGFITPLHGYSGAQVRLCVNAGRSFGIGILLPSRFYHALVKDDAVDAFVTALAHRVKVARNTLLVQQGGAAEEAQVVYGAGNA
jgi:hypothetical protein